MKFHFLPLSALVNLLLALACPAEVEVVGQNSTEALKYSTQTSSTDLINAGQSTLASATVTPTAGSFPGTGINDGAYSNTFGDNTYFALDSGNFPATATYNLNVSVNTQGYDITSIKSFMGFFQNSQLQGNQTYTIDIRRVGSTDYIPLASIAYSPFAAATSGGSYESMVAVDDSSGVLASGVDSIRFNLRRV